jgi:hypothetical protein
LATHSVCRLVYVVAAYLASAPAFATDFHAQFANTAAVYLLRDRTGQSYALELPGPNDTTLARHYVTAREFTNLAALGLTIAYLPEHPDATLGPCTSAPFPRDFDIAFVDGVVFGNVAKCDPNGRPVSATRQNVDFVLFTSGYKAQAAHTVVMPWFKNALHGHGIYFGDTSAFPCANGQDARYDTRIEAWSQWAGSGPPRNPHWTSTGPAEAKTCGTSMDDGWTPANGSVAIAYDVHVRATEDQWVRYDVRAWDGRSWREHTSPIVRDMRYANWQGDFDPSANGLFIGSTGPLGASSGAAWVIGVRDLSVSWSSGWANAPRANAVEYYNTARDHYFVTADAHEIADLDAGVHPGWARTGESFTAGTPAVTDAESVCRFYGLPAKGLDSHFYSANVGECNVVATRFADAWLFESSNVFTVDLPDTVDGSCPANTTPVYRLWNGRTDSNHRYVTDLAFRASMIARGYIPEGYGPQAVAMCSPIR